MAPTASPLQEIRRQLATRRRLTAPVMAGSAFRRIEKANTKHMYGRGPLTDDGDVEKRILNQVTQSKVKKVVPKKKQKPTARRTPSKPSETKEPVVESWPLAGGWSSRVDGDAEIDGLTRIIGIARVSTWNVEAFREGLEQVIAEHGELQDIVTQECMDGAETVTDLYAVFRSELVAEAVKQGIDGKMVQGRMLQVRPA